MLFLRPSAQISERFLFESTTSLRDAANQTSTNMVSTHDYVHNIAVLEGALKCFDSISGALTLQKQSIKSQIDEYRTTMHLSEEKRYQMRSVCFL